MYNVQAADSLELYDILRSHHEKNLKLKNMGVHWTHDALKAELEVGAGIATKSDNGQIVSFILFRELNKNLIEINLLATRPESVGLGHMESLLKNLIKISEGKEIWLEVHEENHKALKLYNKFGFLVTGRRANYYKDGGDAVLLSFKG